MTYSCIYLDSAATSKVSDDVKSDIIQMLDKYGNPSSIHETGRDSRGIIESAREKVRKYLGADEDDLIIFTGSGTEANNIAIQGLYNGNEDLTDIIVSPTEHPSVRNIADHFEDERIIRVHWAMSNYKTGAIDLDNIDVLIDEIRDTWKNNSGDVLVSVMYGNNETGVINDVKGITEIAHRKEGVYVHCDATQAVGKVPCINVKDLGIDTLAFSCHKMGLPKGIGVLYVSSKIKDLIKPIMFGGGQEFGLRSGTENIPYIYALGEVCSKLSYPAYYHKYIDDDVDNNLKIPGKAESKIRDYFEQRLLTDPKIHRYCHVKVNFKKSPYRLPFISSVLFTGYDAQAIMTYLSSNKIYVSVGSACSNHENVPSRTLLNLGFTEEGAGSVIRFSFSENTTIDQIDEVIRVLRIALKMIGKKQ